MLSYVLINIAWVIGFVYLNLKLRTGLHILQLEHYKTKAYMEWTKTHTKKVWNMKELSLIVPVVTIPFNFMVGLILEIIIFALLCIMHKEEKEKKPFVITNRIKRMYITNTIIFICLLLLANLNLTNLIVTLILNVLYSIYIVISFYVVIILNKINQPIEKKIQKGFYNKAQEKLESHEGLQIIGITGSYGKTSTKYIVSTILEQKYNVLMTPESYNTTMGVVRTINENLRPEHQIFVCEMGARNIGDIREICDLVKPKYGILTSIGPQHLDTFYTIENVKKTKMELVDSLPEERNCLCK